MQKLHIILINIYNKILKLKFLFLILPLFLMIFQSCFAPINTTNYTNIAATYIPGSMSLHPEYIVYHCTDSTSQLYFKINPRELLFNRTNFSGNLSAIIKLHYELKKTDKLATLVDSSTVSLSVNHRNSGKDLITYLTIKTPANENYNLHIKTTDTHRQETVTNILEINKKDISNKQNFLITSSKSRNPFFTKYIDCEDTISIESNRNKSDKVTIRYYGKEFKLAPPPFLSIKIDSMLSAEPDSINSFDFQNRFKFRQPSEGVYFYNIDSNQKDAGFSLATFEQYFPESKRPAQLVPPMQYLMTRQEFSDLKNNENPKLAIDDFWLNIAGSIEQGKEMIRIYYNRIYYANRYFSNHTYGWRTDRGMLYTIFGPPNIVIRNEEIEKWTYNDRKGFKTVNFTFVKVPNIFSDNHYVLKRNYYYNDFWQRGVASWRKGKIFYLGN